MSLKWRDNIHKTLQKLNKGWETSLPLTVIDAIDAAYLQGLEEHNKLSVSSKTLRTEISKILVKHQMPTRQVAISEIVELITK